MEFLSLYSVTPIFSLHDVDVCPYKLGKYDVCGRCKVYPHFRSFMFSN